MAFNIEKAKQYSAPKSSGGFNMEKAVAYGQPIQTVKQQVDFQKSFSEIKTRRLDETSVRLPFSQRKAPLGGGTPTRFMANLVLRGFEDLVVGGTKVAATVTGENVSLPFAITHEPTLSGEAPVTQQDFEPMNRAALNRINQLDRERPGKSFLNLLQGTTEEVFLPILNAVDIVGIISFANRVVRKITFSKEAATALTKLKIGLLGDTSEAGVKRAFSDEVVKNTKALSEGKITPEQFVKKMDDIGAALDTLSTGKTTRFGAVGKKINEISTALETERKLSKAIDDKVRFNIAEKTRRSAIREATRTKLEVKSVAEGGEVPIKTTEIKYTPDKDLPVIDYGKTPTKKDNLPIIDIDEPLKNVNVSTKDLIKEIPLKERKQVISDVRRYAIKGTPYDVAEEKAYANYLKAQDKRVAEFVPTEAPKNASPLVKQTVNKLNDAIRVKIKPTSQTTTVKKVIVKTDDVAEVKPKTKVEEPKKKGVSKFAERVNRDLPEGSKIDELYDVKHINKESEKAAELIEKDKTKAVKKAFKNTTSSTERVSILLELAQVAKNSGDVDLLNTLLSNARLLGTDSGQALNMFKAYGLANPETKFMQDIVEARLGKISLTADEISSAGSRSKAYTEKVYTKTKKEITKKVDQAVIIEDVQKLFDSLIC